MTFAQFWQREKVTVGFDLDPVSQISSGPPAATSLVPLEHFHSVARIRFITGVALGVLISLTTAIPASKYIYGRRNSALPGGRSGQGTASSYKTSDLGSDIAPAPLPTALNPLADNPKQASQQTVRLNRLAANHWTDASLPAHSQTPALIAAHQPASGIAASPLRGTDGKIENQTKPAASLEKLWSGVQTGNLNSTLKLADLYARGDGVAANCPQARVLLTMAAKKGSAEATRRLQRLDSACPATPGE